MSAGVMIRHKEDLKIRERQRRGTWNPQAFPSSIMHSSSREVAVTTIQEIPIMIIDPRKSA